MEERDFLNRSPYRAADADARFRGGPHPGAPALRLLWRWLRSRWYACADVMNAEVAPVLVGAIGALALALALVGCRQEPPAPQPVSLILERASVDPAPHGMNVRCEAVLANRTGESIAVSTNFGSPFDGISVVISSEDGEEIRRQSYIYHQSPYAENRSIDLTPGETRRVLMFPMDGPAPGSPWIRVRLEGGLPGTRFAMGLSSNDVRVSIGDGRAGPE
jgi:hypothetical protein